MHNHQRSNRKPALAFVRRRCLMTLLGSAVGGVTAIVAPESVSGQQQVTIRAGDIGSDPMGSLNDACEMDRELLDVRVVARNSSVNGRAAESVAGGWIVVDRVAVGEHDIVLLDEQLQEKTRWTTEAGPDQRWADPKVLAMMPTGEVAAIDARAGPALVIPGRLGSHPVFGNPTHAVALGPGAIVYASEAGVFELDVDRGATRHLWSLGDFGMALDPENGEPPKFRLRTQDDGTLHVAWTIQSSVWTIEGESEPRRRVQRCVPEPLLRTHFDAPEISLAGVKAKASVTSLADFVVLESGETLALGALGIGGENHRSIELYGADGSMKQAWELPVTRTRARFAFGDPRRILLLRHGTEDRHMALVEVQGEGYPSR